TDDGNALLFADTYTAQLRYVAQRGTWLTWDGHRWAWDEAGRAVELARSLVRNLDTSGFDEDMQKAAHRHKNTSLSRNKITAWPSPSPTSTPPPATSTPPAPSSTSPTAPSPPPTQPHFTPDPPASPPTRPCPPPAGTPSSPTPSATTPR